MLKKCIIHFDVYSQFEAFYIITLNVLFMKGVYSIGPQGHTYKGPHIHSYDTCEEVGWLALLSAYFIKSCQQHVVFPSGHPSKY